MGFGFPGSLSEAKAILPGPSSAMAVLCNCDWVRSSLSPKGHLGKVWRRKKELAKEKGDVLAEGTAGARALLRVLGGALENRGEVMVP